MLTTLSIPWLAPGVVWRAFPLVLTFEGEYVIKDVVVTSAALVLAVSLRGPSAAAERRLLSRLPLPSIVRRLFAEPKDVLEQLAKRHHMTLLRVALGSVFLIFGALKLVPGASALEPLSRALVPLEPFAVFYSAVGIFEILIAVSLVTSIGRRLGVARPAG